MSEGNCNGICREHLVDEVDYQVFFKEKQQCKVCVISLYCNKQSNSLIKI